MPKALTERMITYLHHHPCTAAELAAAMFVPVKVILTEITDSRADGYDIFAEAHPGAKTIFHFRPPEKQ